MKEWIGGERRGPRHILSDLVAAYEDELRAAAQLRAHAERVPYPQAAATLRQLAEVEHRHAQALSEQISARGGSPNVVQPTIYEGLNHWDRMAQDYHLADDKRRRYLVQAIHWHREYPKEAELLSRIAAEDTANRRLLEDLVSKADSLARN